MPTPLNMPNESPRGRCNSCRPIAALAIFWAAPYLAAQPFSPVLARLDDSIATVAENESNAPAASPQAVILRRALSQEEIDAPLEFEVALKMRNFAELQSRLQRGEIIARGEMAEKYFPLESDYEKVAAWLEFQGLTVTRRDPSRLAIFASGSVNSVALSFGVAFARVVSPEGEFTSAVTAPLVPADIAAAIFGVNGLQPQICLRHHATRLRPDSTTSPFAPPYLPSELATAYNAGSLALTGTGQTIAIVDDAYPATPDLSSFWSVCGVNQSLNNMQFISVGAGPPGHPDTAAKQEATLDVEWASAIAAGAVVRVYGVTALTSVALDQAYAQIYNDLPNYPGLKQVSLSFGGDENGAPGSQLQTDDAYFAELASAGVTVFAAAGDDGLVQSPASDPNVTGVGGTSLVLNSNGTIQSETVWSSTGGGLSGFFSRPSWQTGKGVPGGSMRCVPDVALSSDPNNGGLVIYNGAQYSVGGTSWATPTWAGFCAMINQARANSGLSSIGLLGRSIYPLIGSASFNDITSGSNGLYSAGPGYDLCTGIGTPSVATLVQTLETVATPQPTGSGAGPSSGKSSGGGGGAFSDWFLGALAFASLLRHKFRRTWLSLGDR
jgi:kumamolisin